MLELRNYVTNQGISCQPSCIKDILAHYGLDIDESDLYCLGDGFRYIYDQQLAINEQKLKIHTDIPGIVQNFMERFKIGYKTESNIDNHYAEESLIASIQNDTPVIIAVSNSDLEYDIEFKQHSTDMGHLITVIGIDRETDRIKISDGFIPSSLPRKFQGWCNYSQIKHPREKWRNWYFTIDKASVAQLKQEYNQDLIIDLVEEALYKSIRELVQGSIVDNKYFGIEALKKYHTGLQSFEDHSLNNFQEKLYQQNIYMKMEGFIDNKQYLSKTIKKLADIRQKKDLYHVYEQLEGNLKKWINFCLMIVKVSIADAKEKMAVLANKFEELYLEEIGIYNSLLSCRSC